MENYLTDGSCSLSCKNTESTFLIGVIHF